MTPPDANVKKQTRRHWPVFWGIAGAILLAVLGWFLFAVFIGNPDEPGLLSDVPEPREDQAGTADGE